MKKVLIFTVSFLAVLALSLSYIYFLKDEYSHYLANFPMVSKDVGKNDISVDLYIKDFDNKNCLITYCVLGNCNNSVQLPCEKSRNTVYEKEDIYRLEMNFKGYLFNLLPKKDLKDWSIEALKWEDTIVSERYFKGLRNIFTNYSIHEAFSCLVPNTYSDITSWSCKNNEFFSHEYLKSVYLTYELGEKLQEEILLKSFNEEIEYLNSNKVEILDKYKELTSGYILKLIDLGLDEGYLVLINSEVPNSGKQTLEDHEFLDLVEGTEEKFTRQYKEIVEYAENARIFKEYNEDKLSAYFFNKMVERYNSSRYVLYGLCSIGHSNKDMEIYKYIQEKLQSTIEESLDTLILKNLSELIECKKYSEDMDRSIIGLDDAITDLVKVSSIDINGESYIIDSTLICIEEEEGDCEYPLLSFRLIDNLLYLINE